MKRTLILATLTLILLALCSAAVIYSQEKPDYSPQVVFVVYKSENGLMQIIPKTQVWFRVGPVSSESHPAPLPDGTNMLCRYYTLHANSATYMAIKCGADDYLVRTVGINPEK
jgi:hypothetical protein